MIQESLRLEHFTKVQNGRVSSAFNILAGDMTLVGTRPEVPRYVKKYTKEMYATLLLPAGLTSRTSIAYKDEDKLLGEAVDEKVQIIYI